MNAVIVEEEVQADLGRTVLTFGPTRHLTPQDLVERLKTTRPGGPGRARGQRGGWHAANSEQRATGAPPAANNSVVASRVTRPPVSDSTCPTAGQRWQRRSVYDLQLYDASTTAPDGTKTLKVGVRFGNVTPNGVALEDGTDPWPDVFTAESLFYTYEFPVTADWPSLSPRHSQATGRRGIGQREWLWKRQRLGQRQRLGRWQR